MNEIFPDERKTYHITYFGLTAFYFDPNSQYYLLMLGLNQLLLVLFKPIILSFYIVCLQTLHLHSC